MNILFPYTLTGSLGALQFPKYDLNPEPPSAHAEQYLSSSDWNAAQQSLIETALALTSGSLFGLQRFATAPTGSAGPNGNNSDFIWLDASGNLKQHLRSGVDIPIVTDMFNVKQYGALGIGTDDTAAIIAAINAASVAGGTVYFPSPGKYGISSPIKISSLYPVGLFSNMGGGGFVDSPNLSSGSFLMPLANLGTGSMIRYEAPGGSHGTHGAGAIRGLAFLDPGNAAAIFPGQYFGKYTMLAALDLWDFNLGSIRDCSFHILNGGAIRAVGMVQGDMGNLEVRYCGTSTQPAISLESAGGNATVQSTAIHDSRLEVCFGEYIKLNNLTAEVKLSNLGFEADTVTMTGSCNTFVDNSGQDTFFSNIHLNRNIATQWINQAAANHTIGTGLFINDNSSKVLSASLVINGANHTFQNIQILGGIAQATASLNMQGAFCTLDTVNINNAGGIVLNGNAYNTLSNVFIQAMTSGSGHFAIEFIGNEAVVILSNGIIRSLPNGAGGVRIQGHAESTTVTNFEVRDSSTFAFVDSNSDNLTTWIGNRVVNCTGSFQATNSRRVSIGNTWDPTGSLINIKDSQFGAVGDGVANDTLAIRAAIASGPANATIYFPRGKYLVTGTLAATNNFQHFRGDEPGTTTIVYAPTAAEPSGTSLFKFTGNGAELAGCSLEKMQIQSTDTTLQKVAVDILDNDQFFMQDVWVNNWTGGGTWLGGGTGSIAFRSKGRQSNTWGRLRAFADQPFRIASNPDIVTIVNSDHFHVYDTYFVVSGSNAGCFIDDGVVVTNFTIDGDNAWVGGKNMLYWRDTSTATVGAGVSANVNIRNIRWEQVSDTTGWSVWMERTGSSQNLQNVKFENIYFPNTTNGARFQNVLNMTFMNCVWSSTSSVHIDVTGGGVTDLVFINNLVQGGGATCNFGTMMPVLKLPQVLTSAPMPATAIYVDQSTYSNQPFLLAGQIHVSGGINFDVNSVSHINTSGTLGTLTIGDNTRVINFGSFNFPSSGINIKAPTIINPSAVANMYLKVLAADLYLDSNTAGTSASLNSTPLHLRANVNSGSAAIYTDFTVKHAVDTFLNGNLTTHLDLSVDGLTLYKFDRLGNVTFAQNNTGIDTTGTLGTLQIGATNAHLVNIGNQNSTNAGINLNSIVVVNPAGSANQFMKVLAAPFYVDAGTPATSSSLNSPLVNIRASVNSGSGLVQTAVTQQHVVDTFANGNLTTHFEWAFDGVTAGKLTSKGIHYSSAQAGLGSAPSASLGTAAGTGATWTISGTVSSHMLTITPAGSPAAGNAPLAIVTFPTAGPGPVYAAMTVANSASAGLPIQNDPWIDATATFVQNGSGYTITGGNLPLVAGTAYKFWIRTSF